MKKTACPACKEAAGFSVIEVWPPVNFNVSATMEVEDIIDDGERTYKVACKTCGADISGTPAGGRVADLVAEA
jgi:hypothetical protein